jgi:hypothetical protein
MGNEAIIQFNPFRLHLFIIAWYSGTLNVQPINLCILNDYAAVTYSSWNFTDLHKFIHELAWGNISLAYITSLCMHSRPLHNKN